MLHYTLKQNYLFPFFFIIFIQSSMIFSVESEDPVLSPSLQDIQHPSAEKNPLEYEEELSWKIQKEEETETFEAKFMNMLLVLGLLIGFMVIASWALKRMMRSKMTLLNTSSSIKVLETRYLSPRATLYLVEAENQTFLIAESPTTVTALSSFPVQENQLVQE